MELITHAAIMRLDKCIVYDRDHARCIRKSPFGSCKVNNPDRQGFLTSNYRYVNRSEALAIATEAGQLNPDRLKIALTSEEFWSPSMGGKHDYDEAFGYVPKRDVLND